MRSASWALLALAACRAPGAVPTEPREAPSVEAPRVAVSPEAPNPDASGSPASPFHDAVIGNPDPEDAQLPNALRVCPFRGRTFICGVGDAPLISTDDGVVTDEDLEAKVRADAAVPLPWRALTAGSWPDSAWMVGGLGASVAAYHHTRGGWARFATWSSDSQDDVIEWEDGLLFAPFASWSQSGDQRVYSLAVVHKGDRSFSPVSTKLAPGTPLSATYLSPVRGVARAGDVLFVAAEHGAKLAVERKGNGADIVDNIATLEQHADGDVERATAHLWARSPSLAVVFGSANGGALLQRFDGRAWAPVPVPSEIKDVVAYDRTTDGKERLFASDFSLYERSLDGRTSADSWKAVPMPTLDHEDSIHGVWLANDDAWLLLWADAIPAKPHSTRPPRLMRMKPVKHVWRP